MPGLCMPGLSSSTVSAMATSLDAWWSSGTRRRVETADGGTVELFVRSAGAAPGAAPTVTLLHGYPSSSHDWQEVSAALEPTHHVLALDLLGFGRSDKPAAHAYAITEQADLLEQVWRQLDVRSTHLVVHDYSATLGQELLSRPLAVELESITFLNGGVYPELHRPTDGQLLLRSPDGDAVAQAIDEPLFAASVAATFGTASARWPERQTGQLQDMWRALARDDGQLLLARLLHYMDDRAVHGARWVEAMEAGRIPTTFVWGPEDPVSGAHMLTEIRRRQPAATVVELEGVGHWPMLEAPEATVAAVRWAVGGAA